MPHGYVKLMAIDFLINNKRRLPQIAAGVCYLVYLAKVTDWFSF